MIELFINKNSSFKDVIPILAGEERCAPSHSFGPYVRKYYIVHYCISGKGRVENPSGVYEVRQGEMFVIRPGESVTYTADSSAPWHYAWVGFVGSHAERFNNGRTVYTCPGEVFERLRALSRAGERSPRPYASVVQDIIYYATGVEENESDAVSLVRRYIEYNYMKDLRVEDIAHAFGMERSYMYRLFKARYCMGVKEYLTEYRLERAKEMLIGGYSVAKTAALVGYTDEFNFAHAFKKHVGVSPGAWKIVSSRIEETKGALGANGSEKG